MAARRRLRRVVGAGIAEEAFDLVPSQSHFHSQASNRPPRGGAAANGEVDWYTVLGIPYSATTDDIRRAYREAMKEIHPDRRRAEQRAAAEEEAKRLNQAYAILSDPDRRRDYDSKIRANIIQEQLMRRYVGGFLTPDMVGPDEHGAQFRREPTAAEQRDQARAARSAMVSVVIVFTAIAVIVVALLLLWAILGQLISAL